MVLQKQDILERKNDGGYVLMYSGSEARRKHDVAMMVGPEFSRYLQDVKLINERLTYCIMNMYAPQQEHSEEEKKIVWTFWKTIAT